jgi:hypothetical protein
MATSPDSSKRNPSQEQLLLDYVRRLEKHRDDRKVVHIHLSDLRPFNRREQHIRAAANGFEALVQVLQGQLFTLKNSDLVFIYKSDAQIEVDTVVQKIRFLFSDDPLLVEEEPGGQDFASWHDAQTDFDKILHIVQGHADGDQKRQSSARNKMDTRAALKARQEQGEPLTPEILARVETALVRADLSNLVRRQYICSLNRKMIPTPEFSELFISINDLRETLLPGVNLLANRWLFQHLTETLDLRMLSMLTKTDHITISGDISFNLNVSTLLSSEFLSFDDNIAASRRGTMVIELQKLDIFADLSAFLFAREFVQEKGYRICLDGLTHETMALIDRERLDVDLIKIIWHPDLIDSGTEMHDRIRGLVERAGEERVILCRVDNREAVDFGHSIGISMFQGRHVENLIAEDGRRKELLRLKRRIERS